MICITIRVGDFPGSDNHFWGKGSSACGVDIRGSKLSCRVGFLVLQISESDILMKLIFFVGGVVSREVEQIPN